MQPQGKRSKVEYQFRVIKQLNKKEHKSQLNKKEHKSHLSDRECILYCHVERKGRFSCVMQEAAFCIFHDFEGYAKTHSPNIKRIGWI